MAKSDFYNMDRSAKEDIFTEVATHKGMKPFAVEKDWWVCRTLEIIFRMPIAKHLVFKGGTSLSKAWKLINRFSEDIDLALDKDFFDGYQGEISKTQISKLRKIAGSYTTGTFKIDLEKSFIESGFRGLEFIGLDAKDSDKDPRLLEIYYPNVIKQDSGYLLPKVQIEVSCRSLLEPFSDRIFGSMVDEFYADKDFADPLFKVPTVNAERTFLEKVFLLHEEFHRPSYRMRVDRLSRHLYDIFCLTQAGVAKSAISDKGLYETIVAHRQKFSRLGEVNYDLHHPHTINPIPPKDVIDDWEADYIRMKEDMIYDVTKPSFEDLIRNLEKLRVNLQEVGWCTSA